MNDAADRARLNALEAVELDAERAALQEAQRVASGRTWAAFMLARSIEVCASILTSRPVLAGRLDGEVLRHALRGGPLPPADDYIEITADMLDAVNEAGPPVTPTTEGGGRR